ncbi:glycosyltransferase [Cognatishimia sp.]|uniref:glycosyltransferase n=1 Tax=Cognatishimia sp. TaxID=2211648 RepID=UPI003518A93D
MTTAAPMTVIQGLMLPEPDLGADTGVYVHIKGAVSVSKASRSILFKPGGTASFNTYANLFNLAKWRQHCALTDLSVNIGGSGRFELLLFADQVDQPPTELARHIIDLSVGDPVTLPFPFSDTSPLGHVHIELTALESGAVDRLDWVTHDEPQRAPKLLMSITTFRREAAVEATVKRFNAYFETSERRDQMHLVVVDNGRSANIAASDHVTVIENENLGGAGGFARGLLEAQQRNYTYCLFMDDDASVHMQAIERTWAFLAFAKNDATAIVGALAQSIDPSIIWENGATFNKTCQSLDRGVDLQNSAEVTQLEHDSVEARPDNFYGGWWFYAFPIAHVRHFPFPFFVRGDDVSFSLVHDFAQVTLNGVISFQDEDFPTKETPLTVYLDLRSHLIHHLALPHMRISRAEFTQIIWWFFFRALLPSHYETLEALNLALGDVLKGPEFFRDNADLADRRAVISKLTHHETWRERGPDALALSQTDDVGTDMKGAKGALFRHSMNGHLLPGFRYWGRRVALPASERSAQDPILGAAQITYVTSDGQKSYTVRHSKLRAFVIAVKYIHALGLIWWRYESLKQTWEAGYRDLTDRQFWRQRLKMRDREGVVSIARGPHEKDL